MSSIIYGNTRYQGDRSLLKQDLDYKYPGGLNLRPGSKLHERIKSEVLTRAQESAAVMSSRFSSCQNVTKFDEHE